MTKKNYEHLQLSLEVEVTQIWADHRFYSVWFRYRKNIGTKKGRWIKDCLNSDYDNKKTSKQWIAILEEGHALDKAFERILSTL